MKTLTPYQLVTVFESLIVFKVDREDHFYHSDFLHLIMCVLLGYIASNLVRKMVLTDVKKM